MADAESQVRAETNTNPAQARFEAWWDQNKGLFPMINAAQAVVIWKAGADDTILWVAHEMEETTDAEV